MNNYKFKRIVALFMTVFMIFEAFPVNALADITSPGIRLLGEESAHHTIRFVNNTDESISFDLMYYTLMQSGHTSDLMELPASIPANSELSPIKISIINTRYNGDFPYQKADESNKAIVSLVELNNANNKDWVKATYYATETPTKITSELNYTLSTVDDETTITFSKREKYSHTANVIIDDGVDFNNLYVVFRQPSIYNDGKFAYSFEKITNEKDSYSSGNTLKNPEQEYDPDKETIVSLMYTTNDPANDSWLFSSDSFGIRNNIVYNDNSQYPENDPEYLVKIKSNDKNTTTITISEPPAPTYSAAIEFFDAWSDSATNDASIDEGTYKVTATVDSNTYTAEITKNGFGEFYNGTEAVTALPANISSWEFTKDGNSVNKIGDYVISDPEIIDGNEAYTKVYHFKAQQPNTYKAKTEFFDANNNTVQDVTLTGYTVVAKGETDDTEYTASLINGELTFDPSTLYKVSEFKIKEEGTEVSRVKDSTGAKYTYVVESYEDDQLGEDHTYKLVFTAVQNCKVNVTSVEGLEEGYDYYILALNESGEAIGYAPFAVCDDISFTFGAADDAIDNTTTFRVVRVDKNFSVSLDVLAAAEGISSSGALGTTEFNWNAVAAEGVYSFASVEKTNVSADFQFLDAMGQPDNVPEEIFFIRVKNVAEDNTESWLFAQIVNGTLNFKDDNGNEATLNRITEVTTVRKLKPDKNISDIVTWNNVEQNTDGVPSDNGSYNLKEHWLYTSVPAIDETNKTYHFVAAKPGEFTVKVECYTDSDKTTPISAYEAVGELKVVAQIAANDDSGNENTWSTEKDVPKEGPEAGKAKFDGPTKYSHNNGGVSPQKRIYRNGDTIALYLGLASEIKADEGNGTISVAKGIEESGALKGYQFTRSYDAGTNTYTYIGTPITPYEVEIRFQDAQYKLLEEAPTIDLNRYRLFVTANDGTATYSSGAQQITLTSSDITNKYSQFDTHYYNPTDEIAVSILYRSEGDEFVNGSTPAYGTTVLGQGDSLGGFAISSIRAQEGKTVITCTQATPYHYSLSVLDKNEAESGVEGLDTSKLALVHKLTKSNGDVYYYVDEQSLNNKTAENQIKGDIASFNLLYQDYNTVSANAIYVGGGSVETVLVQWTSNDEKTPAGLIRVAFEGDVNSGVAYRSGDGIGKYDVKIVNASDTATVELEEAAAPVINVYYEDEKGVKQASVDLEDEYYIYARLDNENDKQYGFVQKLTKSASGDPLAERIENVSFKNASGDEKYLTGESSFSVFLVKKNGQEEVNPASSRFPRIITLFNRG